MLKLDAMLVHWYPHGLEDVLAVHYAVALKNVEQFNRKNVGRTLQFRARKHQRGRISLPGPPGEDRREGVERCRGKLAKNASHVDPRKPASEFPARSPTQHTPPF